MIAAAGRTVRSVSVPAPHASWILAAFLIAQVLDGLLTYIGIRLLGVDVEANALLASAIDTVGAAQALLFAKVVACVAGYFLYRAAAYRPLAFMAGLYFVVAVIPWLGILRGVLVSLVVHGPIKP